MPGLEVFFVMLALHRLITPIFSQPDSEYS
jgi:hypothetical protein